MLAAPCTDLVTCVGDVTGAPVSGVVSGVVGSIAGSAWEAVCKSFGDALVSLLAAFATAFTAFPSIDPTDPGIRSVYSLSLGIAAVVAAFLLLIQITRTVVTHDGSALAHGVVGLGKAVLAFLLTLTVAGAALTASNELTRFIVNQTFGNADSLKTRLGAVFVLDTLATGSPSLLLFVAVVGILLVLVLWFELLLANAAVAVLIGTSPIAAAGQASTLTGAWWPKLVSATTQLIILKPVIALVFAIGFGLAGNATDLAGILSGLLVLLLAVLAWPVIARFFTFASIHAGGGSGLAAVLGFAAGRMNGSSSGTGSPGVPEGMAGDDFASASEQRTLATHAARTNAAGSGAGAGAGASGGAAGGGVAGGGAAGGAAGGGAAAAGAAAGPLIIVAAALDAAQRAANALTGRMEQTAGFAGLDGANPHPYPAGYPRHAPVPFPRPSGGSDSGSGGAGDGAGPSGPAADPGWPGTGDRPDVDTDTPASHGVEAPAGQADATTAMTGHSEQAAGGDTGDGPPGGDGQGWADGPAGHAPDDPVPVAAPVPAANVGETTTEPAPADPDPPTDGGRPTPGPSPTGERPVGHGAADDGPTTSDGGRWPEPHEPSPPTPSPGSGSDARVERRAVRRPDPQPGTHPGNGPRPGPDGPPRSERNPS
jgi:hypothetical protein